MIRISDLELLLIAKAPRLELQSRYPPLVYVKLYHHTSTCATFRMSFSDLYGAR